jgi:hypothetical protein
VKICVPKRTFFHTLVLRFSTLGRPIEISTTHGADSKRLSRFTHSTGCWKYWTSICSRASAIVRCSLIGVPDDTGFCSPFEQKWEVLDTRKIDALDFDRILKQACSKTSIVARDSDRAPGDRTVG